MLQKESVVRLADNTGATEAKIMQVYPGDTKIAYSGHVARILIKRIKKIRVWAKMSRGRTRKILFKRAKRRCWIVRTAYNTRYLDGTYLRFQENAVVLTRVKRGVRTFRGRRFFGMISRNLQFEKLSSLFGFVI